MADFNHNSRILRESLRRNEDSGRIYKFIAHEYVIQIQNDQLDCFKFFFKYSIYL